VVQQKIKITEQEAGTLKETCAYLKGQVDLLEKQTKEARDRTSLKQAHELETIPEELKKAGNSLEKQTAQTFELYELIEGVHFPSSYLSFFFLQKSKTLHMSSIFSSKGKILVHTRTLLLIW